jgi:multidrug efflux pump
MLSARLLRHRKENEMNEFEKRSGKAFQNLIDHYGHGLKWVMEHQPLTLVIAIATLIITLFLFYIIPKGFFPIQDTGIIQGISQAPQSISFPAMADAQQQLAKIVLEDPAVANLSSFIGIDGINTTLNSGRMLITLKPQGERDNAQKVIRRLQTKLADVPNASLYLQPVQDLTIDNRVSRSQFQYSVSSANQNEVDKWSNILLEKLKTAPHIQNVASDQQNNGLQTLITIDRDTASRLGISTQQIDDTLYDAFGQRQISIMFTQRNQYRVILEALPQFQTGPDVLNNIYFATPTGGAIPLRTFTQISSQAGPLIITRQAQFPVATLSFNLAGNASLGDAVKTITQIKNNLNMPASVVTSFEGAAKIFQSSLNNEIWLLIAAVLVVYIVLGVLYESYIHPITILSTLPSATMGALIALLLFGDDLTIVALIGIILLIGIVMKNAIMMIDFALEQERVYKKSPQDAIFDAALLRFRPIVMTTMAAMLGAVPLAFGSGMGSELRQPLGIAIIGGLIISQLLTLFTTPVIYLAFDRLARKTIEWSKNKMASPRSGPPSEQGL